MYVCFISNVIGAWYFADTEWMRMDQERELKLSEMSTRLLGVIAVRDLPQIQQIAILSRIGFSPKEIADIVGTTPNTVRVALVGIRRGKKHKKGRKSQKEE